MWENLHIYIYIKHFGYVVVEMRSLPGVRPGIWPWSSVMFMMASQVIFRRRYRHDDATLQEHRKKITIIYISRVIKTLQKKSDYIDPAASYVSTKTKSHAITKDSSSLSHTVTLSSFQCSLTHNLTSNSVHIYSQSFLYPNVIQLLIVVGHQRDTIFR